MPTSPTYFKGMDSNILDSADQCYYVFNCGQVLFGGFRNYVFSPMTTYAPMKASHR